MALLKYLSYLAVVACFAFVTLSLASGLLYVSELIEEHSRIAKTVGKRGIYGIIALHVILYFTDNLPFLQTLFSIACHVIYLQNITNTWPLIDFQSIQFITSCCMVIADHFLWFFYFARITDEARKLRTYRVQVVQPPGFTEIAAFFGLCVWLAPLFLFLSLSANDNAIPLSSSNNTFSGQQQPKGRVSLIRSMFSYVSFDAFPRLRRKDSTAGIIAPNSPIPTSSPLPPGAPPLSYLSPPKSPMSRGQELEVRGPGSINPQFRLDTPPRRSSDLHSPSRNTLGLGMRRAASYSYERDEQ